MSEDLILHFSNSSNQSDQSSKIAKLEARLVGKVSSAVAAQPLVQAQLNSRFGPAKSGGASDGRLDSLVDSDDSDDNGGAYLIQANTQKRRKVGEDSNPCSVEPVQDGYISGRAQLAAADARQKTIEASENNKLGSDANKRKQSWGRATTPSGRGRSSCVSDQARNHIVSPSNGQVENCHCKDEGTLHAKIAALEEELKKSREEIFESHNSRE